MKPDTSARYGCISRALHWLMAALFAWVFLSAIVHALAEKSALDGLLWPTHKHVGVLLLLLGALRLIWALCNARRRPPSLSAAASLGHALLYALMLAVPLIGALRQHGSGRAFSPLGLPLMPERDPATRIDWMVQLGNAWHGNLGWLLLAAVIGHVGAVIWHRRQGHDVLPRMWGR